MQLLQHGFNLLGRHVDVVIDGQLVAQHAQIFAQEAVVVQTADEVFHHGVLLIAEGEHAHLLFQPVIERQRVAINHLFIIGIVVVVGIVWRGHHVVAVDIFECSVECILPFLLFGLHFKVGGFVVVFVLFFIQGQRIVVGFLQRRIIVQFGIDVFF